MVVSQKHMLVKSHDQVWLLEPCTDSALALAVNVCSALQLGTTILVSMLIPSLVHRRRKEKPDYTCLPDIDLSQLAPAKRFNRIDLLTRRPAHKLTREDPYYKVMMVLVFKELSTFPLLQDALPWN